MSIAAARIAGFTHNITQRLKMIIPSTPLSSKLALDYLVRPRLTCIGAREPDNHLLMTAAQLLIQHNWSRTRNTRTEFKSRLASGC